MTANIAWMTPWNAQSAIATFSSNIVRELRRRGHRVQIIRTEAEEALNLAPLADAEPVIDLARTPDHDIDGRFDAVIANIGNYFPYHGALPAFMDRNPVLGIFHDAYLADLAAVWALHRKGSESAPAQLAQAVYGSANAEPYWSTLAEMADRRPMLEWLAPAVAGAVIHSHFWAERLRAACSGDVLVLPLAMPDAGMPAPPPPREDRLVIATIGHVNPNKQAEQVLYAIAGHETLRRLCEYRLIGPVSPPEQKRLEALAGTLGVRRPIFTGWVEDAELRKLMATVDVVCCLRYPILETGSASLITAMHSARPVLVSNHGVYSDVPGDLVYRCAPRREAVDVARHLLAIVGDRAAASERAGRARSYALEFNGAAHYVDGLLPAMEKAASAAPMIGQARRLGHELAALGFSADSPTSLHLGRQLSRMYSGTDELRGA